MRLLPALWCGLSLVVLATPVLALDYRSAADSALLYDAPSAKGSKRFIIARGTPVEIVLTQDSWTKVRDSSGNMSWMESKLLSPQHTVQIRADKADVRIDADEKSAVVFSAEKNVLLGLLEAGSNDSHPGWAKVKHRDGQSGFIKASLVWGL